MATQRNPMACPEHTKPEAAPPCEKLKTRRSPTTTSSSHSEARVGQFPEALPALKDRERAAAATWDGASYAGRQRGCTRPLRQGGLARLRACLRLPVRRPKFYMSTTCPSAGALVFRLLSGISSRLHALKLGSRWSAANRGCGTDVAQQAHLPVPSCPLLLIPAAPGDQSVPGASTVPDFDMSPLAPAARQTQGQTGCCRSGWTPVDNKTRYRR